MSASTEEQMLREQVIRMEEKFNAIMTQTEKLSERQEKILGKLNSVDALHNRVDTVEKRLPTMGKVASYSSLILVLLGGSATGYKWWLQADFDERYATQEAVGSVAQIVSGLLGSESAR